MRQRDRVWRAQRRRRRERREERDDLQRERTKKRERSRVISGWSFLISPLFTYIAFWFCHFPSFIHSCPLFLFLSPILVFLGFSLNVSLSQPHTKSLAKSFLDFLTICSECICCQSPSLTHPPQILLLSSGVPHHDSFQVGMVHGNVCQVNGL